MFKIRVICKGGRLELSDILIEYRVVEAGNDIPFFKDALSNFQKTSGCALGSNVSPICFLDFS